MAGTKQSKADWRVIGHDWAVDFLRKGLLKGRSRHAYLISGSASLGKMTLARSFAMALNCQAGAPQARPCWQCRPCKFIANESDPDLLLAAGQDGAPLRIDAIRQVTRLLALKPYAARYRVAILPDFDQVAPLAQDALLKTLEEPAPHAILILLAGNIESVLPTIRSRVQHLPLKPVPTQLIAAQLTSRGCPDEQAELIARLSSGRIGWALSAWEDDSLLAFRAEMIDLLCEIVAGGRLQRLKIADELSKRIGKDKALLRRILEYWTTYWRDALLQCCGHTGLLCNSDRRADIDALAAQLETSAAHAAITATRAAMSALSTNANLRLLLDALFLDYPRLAG
ncbi:MAG: DNA polymerase III subunit [Chloroflexi bacterium]|nr:DNA polymerase III subunit [Chloroflexota bacterium]